MYLFQLADRLARGLQAVDNKRIRRHRAFILSRQQADGGFMGREGDSDLYYTGFAVRALAMTGGLDRDDQPPGCSERVADWLRTIDPLKLGVIDLLSWLYSALVVQLSGGTDVLASQLPDFPDRVSAMMEKHRVRDGGYAKSGEGASGSTYQSFMVSLAYELIGRPVPRPNALIQFLYDRQRDDGGFVEIDPMKRSGTNPTAAAVALLKKLNGMHPEIADDVIAFLIDVISSEGGFQANTRIPFADGLSTFTALLTAHDLGRRDLISPDKIVNWVTETIELPVGGFRGASWDQQADVEYTFYGLGILGLVYEGLGDPGRRNPAPPANT
jgi:geranylgeranyl transferase type-2 subunit beta